MISEFNRRDMLKRLAATSGFVGLGMSGLLAACGSDEKTATSSSPTDTSTIGTSSASASTGSTAASGSTTTSGSNATTPSGDPIKVGVLTDITGAFSVVGLSNQAIAQFTIDKINSEGGVLGRPLEMVLVDSATDPAIGAQVARKLVEQDKVAMVIGGIASNMREAIKSVIATRGKTIYIWPASYEGGECTDLVFSTGAAPNQQLDPFVPYLLKNAGKSFFLAGADYIYPAQHPGQGPRAGRVRRRNRGRRGVLPARLDRRLGSAEQGPVIGCGGAVQCRRVAGQHSLPQGDRRWWVQGQDRRHVVRRDVEGVVRRDVHRGSWRCRTTSSASTTRRPPPVARRSPPSTPTPLSHPRSIRRLGIGRCTSGRTLSRPAGSIDTDSVAKAMDSARFAGNPGGAAAMKPGTHHCSLPIFIGEVQADGSVKQLVDAGILDPTECG